MTLLQESAAHWRKLAQVQEAQAQDLQARGLYDGVHRNRAEMYNRTAKSLELEITTGKPHCTVCLGPHENQFCPQRPGRR